MDPSTAEPMVAGARVMLETADVCLLHRELKASLRRRSGMTRAFDPGMAGHPLTARGMGAEDRCYG
jgi:hypothetical protein